MLMCRNLKIVILTLLCLTLCGQALAQSEQRVILDRANTLLEHGRYADARHEYLRLKQMVATDDISAVQQVDYGLTVCAVHLDDNIAEQRMRAFLSAYPGSVYAADISFLLALHYCEAEEFVQAKEQFERVNYTSLNRYDRQRYDIRMGYIEFNMGNMDKALGYFNRISPLSEVADHATYYKSYIYYTKGAPLYRLEKGHLDNRTITARNNLLWDTEGKYAFVNGMTLAEGQNLGFDADSTVADPKFADPEHGDFTLAEDSPAYAMGFKRIDISDVGPRNRG